ncbi:hypothetical protein ICV32_00610 [Polynucleobacter sp. MWH-UH24A]|uniref:hypothetical protein n=1 Tax=Polynucleobacter sp. MWH-UH24A TaxID=2689110 RepID=UPI001BFD5A6D|nr:hypothetical protein [Polynucleobacter sp. MWH-UH24A]QWD76218.1 hypothetical protein ICV32_00610 [Polynucleobacter sp. MWH-UH24A]
MMKIIDAVTFFNEVEVLKMRLELLYPVVDTFIICEANYTHSGEKKSFHLKENLDEFEKYKKKIKLINLDLDIKNFSFSKIDSFDPDSGPWKVERAQRDYLYSEIKNFEINDVAIICDVDEIWNPHLAELLRSKKIPLEIARLEMQFHYYWLNCRGVGKANNSWVSAYFSTVGNLSSNQGKLSKIREEAKLPLVHRAGWHFSNLGGANKLKEKIEAFAHQELNKEEIKNIEKLENAINLGIDYLNRESHEWAFHPIDYYPKDLAKVMRLHPNLLRKYLL